MPFRNSFAWILVSTAALSAVAGPLASEKDYSAWVDKPRFDRIMEQKADCLVDYRGNPITDRDAHSLYEAVAILLSDTRCSGFVGAQSKQTILAKGGPA